MLESLTISIPAYNEEKTIEEVVRRAYTIGQKLAQKVEILVIDDGSTDSTFSILKKISAENLPLRIHRYEKNLGFGTTLKEIFSLPESDWIFFLSADGQIPPEELERLVPYTEKFDYIIGWRKNRQDSPGRKIKAQLYNLFVSIIAGYRIHDVDSVVLLKKKILPEKILARSAFIHAEIFLTAIKNRCQIVEVPIKHLPRQYGQASGVKFSVVRDVFVDLLRHFFRTNFWLALVLLLGLFLRVILINFGLPSKNLALTTYNPDEPLSYQTLAELAKYGPLRFSPGREFLWGQFHFWVLAIVMKLGNIFGYLPNLSREFLIEHLTFADRLYILGRWVSILSGFFSIWLVYLIARRLGKITAIFSALALAIMPVHIFNSIYVRPDVLMVFLGLLVVFFSLKILETGKYLHYFLSSFFLGLAIATKYSAGGFIFIPVIAHTLYQSQTGQKLFNRKILVIPLYTVVGFLIGCPHFLINFDLFYDDFLINWRYGGGNPLGYKLHPIGAIYYLYNILPRGLGLPMFLSAVGGFLVLCFSRQIFSRFLLFSFLTTYLIITKPHNQVVWYCLPLAGFLAILTGVFWDWLRKNSGLSGKIILTILLLTGLFYTLAYENLYRGKNIREEASDWIDQNIPKGKTIAIARSYYWTVPILRQYNPPYKLLMGADQYHSWLPEAIKGLEKISGRADYLILTDYEYYNFVRYRQLYLAEYRAYQNAVKNFTEIKKFVRYPEFLGIKLPLTRTMDDWRIPNPQILILKNNAR